MNKALTCIIAIGCSTTQQAFHPKYLDGNQGSGVKPAYKLYTEAAHERLRNLRQCLDMSAEDFVIERDDEAMRELLYKLRQRRTVEITAIEVALKRIEYGTFTFECEERCTHGCANTDLTKEKFAMPGATNCADFRKKQECNITPLSTAIG